MQLTPTFYSVITMCCYPVTEASTVNYFLLFFIFKNYLGGRYARHALNVVQLECMSPDLQLESEGGFLPEQHEIIL